MTAALILRRAGPAMTLQDAGRPGWLARGLGQGGAADMLALAEGAALLGQDAGHAALEMAGMGGEFEATGPLRIALTGAPMRARIDGKPVAWHAAHRLAQGQTLSIGPATAGVYGYLHLGGGIASEPVMESRATHTTAGVGKALSDGAELIAGKDPGLDRPAMKLTPEDRFAGGAVRIVESAQTRRFTEDTRQRFTETLFTRDQRGNRQGMRLDFEGEPFSGEGQLQGVSEIIVPGDIQMTGDGAPFVLMPDCQTIGGYPRIATVIPADMPRVAQAAPGTRLSFRFVSLDEGVATMETPAEAARRLTRRIEPLVRDPHDIPDLLAYTLIDGVTAGDDI